MAEHHVERAGQEVRPRLAAVALDQAEPLTDALGLGREGLPRGGDHLGVGLQTGHRVPGPCEAQGLGALAHPDVEDPQPLSHREAAGYLLVQLPCDQFLPHDVPQTAEAVQPGGRPSLETDRAQGRSPRLT